MEALDSLKSGTVFNKIGSWYSVINKVIDCTEKLALVECHEDDGYVKYYVFERNFKGWTPSYDSSSYSAICHTYEMVKSISE